MTIYLSKIVLNPKSRQARNDLADPYEMHRTVYSLFPDKEDGGPGKILYRVDEIPRENEITLLIQSEKEPDLAHWDSFLEVYPAKEYNPKLGKDQLLMFRLRANPSIKKDGKRLGILDEKEQIEWLEIKSKKGGFNVKQLTLIPEGFIKGKSKSGNKITIYSVRYGGTLQVTNPDKFKKTLAEGIGPGKAFGFGLLSIAPSC